MNQKSCLIIGGGISGLIAGTILKNNQIKVTILDKGKGIGGRLATRRIKYLDREGIFDYGTQYFTVSDRRFKIWVDRWIEDGIVNKWSEGFSVANKEGKNNNKISYKGNKSIRDIAKHLAKELEVYTSTKIVKLNWNKEEWIIEAESGDIFRGDILLMTPPVPQTLALLDNSSIVINDRIRKSLEEIKYSKSIAVLALLENESNIPEPGGLVFREEPLAWIGCNYKKGISPNGYAVTIQAGSKFNEAYWSKDNEIIAKELFTAASYWLNSEINNYQVHKWRYAFPINPYPRSYLSLEEIPLVMAGDAFVVGKVQGAVLSGIAAAEHIISKIN